MEKELERPGSRGQTVTRTTAPGPRMNAAAAGRVAAAAAAAANSSSSCSGGGGGGVRTLEKKNKQLNHATRELEEKVRNLRQRSAAAGAGEGAAANRTLPKVRAMSAPPRELPSAPKSLVPSERQRRGSVVASNATSRAREREAEFAKTVQERDEHIARLKERLKVVSKRLSEAKEGQRDLLVKAATMENGVELQSIIKQVTKERLQLERHLQIANDSLQRNNGVDLQRYLSLEQTNGQLRAQLDSLDILQQEHKLVEIQYREKEEACRELMNTLKYKSALCQDLESQLAKVIEKNTELTVANSDLQKKVVELKDVTEECNTLRTTLSKVENEFVTAKTEVQSLSGKVRNLESVLEEMHRAAENRREIERQHKEALESLKRRQSEVDTVATKRQEELIAQLKAKIEHLEDEKRSQNDRHAELILEMAELKRYGHQQNSSPRSDVDVVDELEQPADNLEIDEIMAKLEQDNKFLEELEKQRAERNSKKSASERGSPGTTLQRASSSVTDSGFLSQSSLNGSSPTTRLGGGSGHQGHGHSQQHSASTGSLNRLPGLTKADKINMMSSGRSTLLDDHDVDGDEEEEETNDAIEEREGMINIPGKGWTFVFVARYSYDPFQHSPNESPEAELQVNAGDYILVWEDADEDGFYDGELLDGRRGLVPSNFVERLEAGPDLTDFHRQVVLGLGGCDDSVCTSVPQDLDFLSSDEALTEETLSSRLRKKSSSTQQPLTKTTSLPQYASCTDLDATEDEEGDGHAVLSSRIPAPRQLTLEAQHNKALVIGWNPPEGAQIECYHVMVDGTCQATVNSEGEGPTRPMKASLDGVDTSIVHRVSVKAVGAGGKTSNEAACTMVFGKDAPLAPTGVRAVRVTSTSCTVCWVPSNSNFMHAICVGGIEVKTVRPGVHRHTLAGLQPNNTYRVSVRAKNLKAAGPNLAGHDLLRQLSTSMEVRTQPRGRPEPPVDVQVSRGPREGTILVSWIPVTINPSGTSNGAPVIGYSVYANGQRIGDVDSGTADQVVVDVGERVHCKAVTVRTRSMNDVMSKDSDPCTLPFSMRNGAAASKSLFRDSDSDSEGELIEKLTSSNGNASHGLKQSLNNGHMTNGFSKPREVLLNYSGYPELDSDIGPSELSDIAEEPEEGLTDNDDDDDDDHDSVTPQNELSSTQPANSYQRSPMLYKPNHNALNHWNNKIANSPSLHKPKMLSSSQFTAQPLTSVLSNNNTPKVSSSSTYISQKHVYHPTIRVTQEECDQAATASGFQKTRQKERIRIFVALFDYDPQTMSPNPDASEEELPFREGQLIKIFGEKDSDGFYWGEGGNRSGYVPCNMVSEVQVDDDHVAEELFKEQSKSNSSTTSVSVNNNTVDDRWGDIYESTPARQKLALYDYEPSELSPNVDSEVELAFSTGDLVTVYGEMDDDGFFVGELKGKRGLVPSNFLTDVPPGYDAKQLARIINGGGSGPGGPGGPGAPGISGEQQPRVLGQQRKW